MRIPFTLQLFGCKSSMQRCQVGRVSIQNNVNNESESDGYTKTSHQDMLRNDAVVSFHAFFFFKCNETCLVPSNSWMHPILTYLIFLGPGHFESWWWSTPTKKCVDPNNWRAASVRNIQLLTPKNLQQDAFCIRTSNILLHALQGSKTLLHVQTKTFTLINQHGKSTILNKAKTYHNYILSITN